MIMDENEHRQPCGLFKASGINLVHEKQVIARKRNRNSREKIPRYLQYIRHLDENLPNGERKERFIQKKMKPRGF